MQNQFSRTELLIGEDGVNKLQNSHVAVFGVGGVGGYAIEALVRSGIGEIDLIDNDVFTESNLNRQIYALKSTLGKSKVEVAKERIMDINSGCKVNVFKTFFTPETSGEFDFSKYNYVVDAIDNVTGKIELVMKCKEAGTPIISSMGTGNKLHPEMLEISDIYKTFVCPLAKVMRQELKKRGVNKLKVVYSKEVPLKSSAKDEKTGKPIPGSIAFVPSAAGLIIASEVVNSIVNKD